MPADLKAQTARIAAACEQELALHDARLGDEYFYQSLPLCVIDAVYSIRAKYPAVQNVVKRYCDHFGLQEFRNSRDQVPSLNDQEPLSALVERMSTLGIRQFATGIFKNRQPTSSRNGILKSEAVFRYATALTDEGVNFLQDVPPKVSDSNLEAKLRRIPGQASGISISYFFMLAGTEDLIKPDRMIGRFLKRHLGYEPSPSEAQSLISGACEILRTKYSHSTPRLLDYVIWSRERAREKNNPLAACAVK
jgi:hypothetical protein